MSFLIPKITFGFKLETTPYTAEVLSANDYNVGAYNISFLPEVEIKSRRVSRGTLPNDISVTGKRQIIVNFTVDMYASVDLTIAPNYFKCLQACGLKQTTYVSGVSLDPHDEYYALPATIEITITDQGINANQIVMCVSGCMGNANIIGSIGQPAQIEFEFVGTLETIQDRDFSSILTPSGITSILPPIIIDAGVSLFGTNQQLTNIVFDFGNSLENYTVSSKKQGYQGARVVDRKSTIYLDPTIELIARQNEFNNWINNTTGAFNLAIGDDLSISASAAQINEGYGVAIRDGHVINSKLLNLNKSNGNDEFRILQGEALPITYAFIASGNSKCMEVVDVTLKDAPVHKNRVNDGDEGGDVQLNRPLDIALQGDYAYLTVYYDDCVTILNIADLDNITWEGQISNGDGGATLNGAQSIVINGNYAYVTARLNHTLEIIDISQPANPTHKGTVFTGNIPYGLCFLNNYIYLTCYGDGKLEIYNVTDRANPILIGSITDGDGGAGLNGAYDVCVVGNYAYVSSNLSDCLEIVDVSDPANPTHKGRINNGDGGALLDAPLGLFIKGNYAYVTVYTSHVLEIIDISDPANPVHASSIVNGGALAGTHNLFVLDDYAYVTASGGDDLTIYNVSNPTSPSYKGIINNGEGGAGLDSPDGIVVKSY